MQPSRKVMQRRETVAGLASRLRRPSSRLVQQREEDPGRSWMEPRQAEANLPNPICHEVFKSSRVDVSRKTAEAVFAGKKE
eukprot:356543-Chlamydomonas_euryale.AAC.11